MRLFALMAISFFTLSSNTTFDNNSYKQEDARKYLKRKDPARTHDNQTGYYHSEFRLDNISKRKIEAEIELYGKEREKKRVTLQPGINTVYTEDYKIPTRRYTNLKIISAKFIPD